MTQEVPLLPFVAHAIPSTGFWTVSGPVCCSVQMRKMDAQKLAAYGNEIFAKSKSPLPVAKGVDPEKLLAELDAHPNRAGQSWAIDIREGRFNAPKDRDCPNCHVRPGYLRCKSCGTEWNAPEVQKCPTCGIVRDCTLCGGSGVQLGELQKDDKLYGCRREAADRAKEGKG